MKQRIPTIEEFENNLNESEHVYVNGYDEKNSDIGKFWKEQRDLLDAVLKPFGQKVLDRANEQFAGKSITIKNITVDVKEFTNVRTGSSFVYDYTLIGKTQNGKIFEITCDQNIMLTIR